MSNGTRISSNYQTSQAIQYLQTNLRSLADLQEKVSSGKNINAPSQDPLGYSKLINIQNSLDADDRYLKNIQQAKAEAQLADSSVNSVIDIINRARELGVQGASDTVSANDRLVMASEIDALMNQLVQIGNTTLSGKYIFGGQKTQAAPFARTATTTVTYAGTPSGETYQRNVEISKGITATINIDGRALLGTVAPAGGAPPPYTTGSGVMRTMGELLSDLQNNNTTEIKNRLDELTTNLQNTLNLQSQLGNVTTQMNLTESRIQDRKLAFTQQYSDLQQVDMAAAITNLNYQENIYNASLGVAAKVIQISLVNFLQ